MAAPSANPLSVIIPARNEAETITATLTPLQPWRARGAEVLVVDGGSTDATRENATPWADQVLEATPGRAYQMNAGAAVARGAFLLFLHADTQPPAEGDRHLLAALAHSVRRWGRFDVQLSGASHRPLLGLVAALMNRRSRLTGIATGDQALFVERGLFESEGGFPDIPLMEDIAFSATLKRAAGHPVCLSQRVITSSRRWEERGIITTILHMWLLRLAFFCGVSPERLVRLYR